jgi:hypothetical protein
VPAWQGHGCVLHLCELRRDLLCLRY